MKLTNITEVDNFLNTVNECSGSVWLESTEGDKINLKSKLSQYIAISALISCEADKLELFCSLPESSSSSMRIQRFYNG